MVKGMMINNHKYEYELYSTNRKINLNYRLLVFLLSLLVILRLVVEEDVLSSAEAKLDHVPLHQLDVPPCFHLLPVDIGAIARVEVDDVGPGRSASRTIRFGHLHRSKLKHGVLLRAGGMVDGHVGHAAVPAKEIGRLPVQGDKLQRRVPFEGIEAPPLPGLLRLRRLVVLDEDAVEGVGVLGEGARQLKVGADFRRWPFGLFLSPFSRVLWI